VRAVCLPGLRVLRGANVLRKSGPAMSGSATPDPDGSTRAGPRAATGVRHVEGSNRRSRHGPPIARLLPQTPYSPTREGQQCECHSARRQGDREVSNGKHERHGAAARGPGSERNSLISIRNGVREPSQETSDGPKGLRKRTRSEDETKGRSGRRHRAPTHARPEDLPVPAPSGVWWQPACTSIAHVGHPNRAGGA
jgi:hypothetical protein